MSFSAADRSTSCWASHCVQSLSCSPRWSDFWWSNTKRLIVVSVSSRLFTRAPSSGARARKRRDDTLSLLIEAANAALEALHRASVHRFLVTGRLNHVTGVRDSALRLLLRHQAVHRPPVLWLAHGFQRLIMGVAEDLELGALLRLLAND